MAGGGAHLAIFLISFQETSNLPNCVSTSPGSLAPQTEHGGTWQTWKPTAGAASSSQGRPLPWETRGSPPGKPRASGGPGSQNKKAQQDTGARSPEHPEHLSVYQGLSPQRQNLVSD